MPQFNQLAPNIEIRAKMPLPLNLLKNGRAAPPRLARQHGQDPEDYSWPHGRAVGVEAR